MEVNGLCIISENHESFLTQKFNHLRYYLTGQSVYSHCAFKLLHDDKPQACPTMLLASA